MTREMTASAIAASKEAEIVDAIFFKAEFETGVVAMHTRLGDISFGGDTYLGVGNLAELSAVEENSEIQAKDIKVTLSGIDATLIAVALQENYQNRPCFVYYGLLDANYTVIADPVLMFRGSIDTMAVTVGETATITVTCQNRLVDWQKSKPRYYTDAEQKSRFPGDRGFELMQESQERKILWGRTV